MSDLVLVPGNATLDQLALIYWDGVTASLDPNCRPAVENAADRINAAASGDVPVYGVNTGFGKLASIKIEASDAATLQRNLILSHCCGVGEPISKEMVRLMMTLKLLSFGRGASGVRWSLVQLVQNMLSKGVTPVIPAQGSVGASGDLAPLAHMTAVVIGEGKLNTKAWFSLALRHSKGQVFLRSRLGQRRLGVHQRHTIFNGVCPCWSI